MRELRFRAWDTIENRWLMGSMAIDLCTEKIA